MNMFYKKIMYGTPYIQSSGVKVRYALLKWGLIMFTIFIAISSPIGAQSVVDATTLNNKIMAGYQGWFRTPGDRDDNKGWAHLFNKDMRPDFDSWPDMRGYAQDEKTSVPGFTYPNGSQAYLYSAQNQKVVLFHFQWMKKYDIDGVWLSEFCNHFPGGSQHYDSTTVLTIMKNVRAAATATGRVWAFMWDMSGFGPMTPKSEVYNIMVNQWKKMVDEGVTGDARYLHHNGKPVLLIWGFFPNRPASQPDYMNPVINFFQAPGKYQATLVAGVDDKWREGTLAFQAMLMKMTALQPWSVGRRLVDPKTGYEVPNTTKWAADIAKCKANNVVFIPVINAGTNIAGPPPMPPKLPIVPRRMGNYLWEQFVAASKTKAINSVFVAMFDEINEGTQIMKVTNYPPAQFPFLTYNGATSDYYLRLVGIGGKTLKRRMLIPPVIPISPFDVNKWYKIKNKATGLELGSQSKRAKASIVQASDVERKSGEWQLLYNGKGYFKIKNHLSGKFIGGLYNGAVVQENDGNLPNSMWHLEWDGTGDCRIINKESGKVLSSGGKTTKKSAVIQVADAKNSDSLRWKIIEPYKK
jgi:hypothetical protein